jgi:radical SAM protein with 4Fe4S-binding SPASM domain
MMDCAAKVDFGSSAHLVRIFAKACRDRVPVFGSLDLTYRCNLRCAHCYVGHLAGQSRSEATELPTEEVAGLLSAAADAGCLMLVLSGGEPLLRPDFLDIYTVAKRLGMLVTVFTNATLVTQRHVQTFEDLPPHAVEVSVYGATEATYERVTGVPGSFWRARRGIDLLLSAGVSIVLKTMILRDNADEVAAVERWAGDLGVRFRMDPLVTPRLDGDRTPLDQRVEPDVAVAIELGDEARREAVSAFLDRERTAGTVGAPRADRLYYCGAGIASFHVDPAGYLRPCLMSRSIAHNAPALGFVAAWKATTAAVDAATWEGVGGCAECPRILLCGYCPGLFELENRTPAHPPEYVCRLGECRYGIIDGDRQGVVGVRAI